MTSTEVVVENTSHMPWNRVDTASPIAEAIHPKKRPAGPSPIAVQTVETPGMSQILTLNHHPAS